MNESHKTEIWRVQFSELSKILLPFTEFYWKPKNHVPVFGVVKDWSERTILISTSFTGGSEQEGWRELEFSSNDLLNWEWFIIVRKGDLALAELLRWKRLKNQHAANLGVDEASELTLIDLKANIKSRGLDDLDYILMEHIISKIISTGETGRYFNEAASKTRKGRSLQKMAAVNQAVNRYVQKGEALDEKGAFSNAGSELSMSASTARRHYYQYKGILNVFEIGDYYGNRVEATINPDTFNYRYKVTSEK